MTQAAAVQIEPDFEPANDVALPKHFNRAKFVYIHHPTSWTVAKTGEGPEDWEILPALDRVDGEPGVNGVTSRDEKDNTGKMRTRLNFNGALRVFTNAGAVVIPDSADARLGKWQRYNTRRLASRAVEGWHYIEPGERVIPVSRNQAYAEFDTAEMHDFLRTLRDNEVIDPPSEVVVGQIRAKLNKAIATREDRGTPSAKKSVQRFKDRLAGLDIAWKKELERQRKMFAKAPPKRPEVEQETEETSDPIETAKPRGKRAAS